MNSPNNRNSVTRRGAATENLVAAARNADPASDTTPGANAVRVVFIDDEPDFLAALVLATRTKRSGIDLRTIQATPDNHLLHALDQYRAQGWHPELLCIDLNEASGKGVAGLDYLHLMRKEERWHSLPIVLTTKTTKSEQEQELERKKRSRDLVHNVYESGADGYLLGKIADRRFIESILNQYPAWRHHARTRIWHGLLEESQQALQAAQSEEQQADALRQTLEKLHTRLGIDHAFVRKKFGNRCPVWVRFNGPWANTRPIDDLTQIPLMADVIKANGRVIKVRSINGPLERGVLQELDGKAYMGCALMLNGQLLGVMTVVCDRADSFGPMDAMHFGRLTEQVAYVLGKQWMEARSRHLRQALLQFSEKLSDTHDVGAVCQTLAETAHAVLHEGHRWAKCTVRLIEPGYPLLRRYGQTGQVVPRADIPLKLTEGAEDSMFRQVVTDDRIPILMAHGDEDFKKSHYFNNNVDASGRPWWKSESAITAPLVLERPDSTPEKPKVSALGAINLETSEPNYYKAPEYTEFIRSIALSASRHITALRTASFAEHALELSVSAYSSRPDELWQGVHDTLFTLLGHNQLIQLDPPEGWDGRSSDIPWIVRRVYSSDPQRFTNDTEKWNQHFGDLTDWPTTFTKQCIEKYIADPKTAPLFTANELRFRQSTDLLDGEKIEANAVFALHGSNTNDSSLHGIVLLSWFSPPVMNKTMFESVLGQFARYCTVLLQHSEDRLTGEERLRRAEGQASIAFAARQFEHILNNRLAALQGSAEAGLNSGDLTETHQILGNIRQQLKRLDERASKSALYMREPDIQPVRLQDIWAAVTSELSHKAERIQARLWKWGSHQNTEPPEDLHVKSDRNYLWNALYVLVDNALDALERQTSGKPRDVWAEASGSPEEWTLSVHDNGPGVTNPEKLFKWGESTKLDGQGVALALARERLAKIFIEIHYGNHLNENGTLFQLTHKFSSGKY